MVQEKKKRQEFEVFSFVWKKERNKQMILQLKTQSLGVSDFCCSKSMDVMDVLSLNKMQSFVWVEFKKIIF